jgi:hypothetical protein
MRVRPAGYQNVPSYFKKKIPHYKRTVLEQLMKNGVLDDTKELFSAMGVWNGTDERHVLQYLRVSQIVFNTIHERWPKGLGRKLPISILLV